MKTQIVRRNFYGDGLRNCFEIECGLAGLRGSPNRPPRRGEGLRVGLSERNLSPSPPLRVRRGGTIP